MKNGGGERNNRRALRFKSLLRVQARWIFRTGDSSTALISLFWFVDFHGRLSRHEMNESENFAIESTIGRMSRAISNRSEVDYVD